MRFIAIACMALVVLSSSSFGGSCDPCDSSGGMTCASMKLNVCPAGDFQMIRDGCTGVGTQYIWVIARCDGPIPGIPPTDCWLNSCSTAMSLWLSAQPITADSATGANGRTTFSAGRIAAGGCNIPLGSLSGVGVYLAIQGKPILAHPLCLVPLCLPIDILSPDLAGPGGDPDGYVSLPDLTAFGTTFNCVYPGPYPPGKMFNACCDYTHDGTTVNVSDFGMWATHWQHKGF